MYEPACCLYGIYMFTHMYVCVIETHDVYTYAQWTCVCMTHRCTQMAHIPRRVLSPPTPLPLSLSFSLSALKSADHHHHRSPPYRTKIPAHTRKRKSHNHRQIYYCTMVERRSHSCMPRSPDVYMRMCVCVSVFLIGWV